MMQVKCLARCLIQRHDLKYSSSLLYYFRSQQETNDPTYKVGQNKRTTGSAVLRDYNSVGRAYIKPEGIRGGRGYTGDSLVENVA